MLCPPGPKATATGWLPSVLSGYDGTCTSVRERSEGSITEIESECPLATATIDSSGLTAMSDGARPTLISVIWTVFVLITDTVPEAVEPVTASEITADPLLAAVV